MPLLIFTGVFVFFGAIVFFASILSKKRTTAKERAEVLSKVSEKERADIVAMLNGGIYMGTSQEDTERRLRQYRREAGLDPSGVPRLEIPRLPTLPTPPPLPRPISWRWQTGPEETYASYSFRANTTTRTRGPAQPRSAPVAVKPEAPKEAPKPTTWQDHLLKDDDFD